MELQATSMGSVRRPLPAMRQVNNKYHKLVNFEEVKVNLKCIVCIFCFCFSHMRNESCRYSHVPDTHNLCRSAHSQEELDEWRERWDWRNMKREIARKEKQFSYMDELLVEYEQAEQPVTVICDAHPDVDVTCERELCAFLQRKDATFRWKFSVQTRVRHVNKTNKNKNIVHVSYISGLNPHYIEHVRIFFSLNFVLFLFL